MKRIGWPVGVLVVLVCTAATVATLGVALIVIVPVLFVSWSLFLEGGQRRARGGAPEAQTPRAAA